jgi:5-methylcytosine-specific restriction endonuclease McrA
MKTCIRCDEAKPYDAFAKAKAKKDGRHPICRVCDAAARKARRMANLDQERARDNARYLDRRDEKRAYDRAYYAANADKIKQNTAHYNRVNRERLRPYHAERAKWREAKKRKAITQWADVGAIREVYLTAKFLTDVLDEPYHVDHIVPLQSALVCGLHVAANLRVLSARDNQSKSNRHWPDMWEVYADLV